MSDAVPCVILLTHTPNPVETCVTAARICYSGLPFEALREKVSSEDQSAFLRGVIRSGHLSVLEHASFTFYVEGVSRALLAQLTRHRVAYFSVQSQRYVSLKEGFDAVIPPRIEAMGEEAAQKYRDQMRQMADWYAEWQEAFAGDPGANEDARFVLPNACATRLVMTMNVRELLHFFSLRCCERAQWEIRAMATEMLHQCKAVAPILFESAGPACVRGACSEGSRSCGRAAEIREKFQNL